MSAPDFRVDDAALPVALPLRRAPLWYSGLTLWLVVTLLLFICAAHDALPRLYHGQSLPADVALSMLAASGCLAMCAALWAKRYITRRFVAAPIVLSQKQIRLPKSQELWGYRSVNYADIVAVHEGGRPNTRALLIESTRHLYYLPQALFVDPLGPERLLLGLRERILALPQKARLIELTEQRRQQARRHMADWPVATQAILGLSAILFVNAWLKGNLSGPFGLLRWGANVPSLVASGEYFRLLAANFLHSHWMHAVINGLSLYYLGNLVERVLGWARLVLIYGISGAIAMLASAQLSGAIMSVGASGAIFGLLGSFAVFSWRLRQALPLEFRQTPRWWMVMLVTNTAVPMYLPSIDIVAHLAGFATGALVSWALLARRSDVPGPVGRGLLAAASVCIGLYLSALGTAVYRAAKSGPQTELAFAERLLDDSRTSASTLNALAWLWAVDEHSDAQKLAMANRSALMACHKEPTQPRLWLTLALVDERQRDFDGAIFAWRQTLERAQANEHTANNTAASADEATAGSLEAHLTTSVYATHLAQAAISRLKDAKVLTRNWPQGVVAPQSMHLSQGVWSLEGLGVLPKAAVVYALLYVDDTPVALVQTRLAANSAPPYRALRSLTEEMGGASHAAVFVVDSEAEFVPSLPQEQHSLWNAWALPESLKPLAR